MAVRDRTTHNLGTGPVVGVGIELEIHECGECGVVFGISKGFMRARREDHDWWYCPNQHGWRFSGESESEKIRRQRDEARDDLAAARASRDQTEASLRATKGVVTKLKKRATAGVCPAGCKRHFKDLERHMASKHREFTGEK
jgi:hypothetical protein